MAVGALMVFFGVIVMLATFARPLADAIGRPAAGVRGHGCARRRQRDPQPAADRGDGLCARHRPRTRRARGDLRVVDEGLGRATPSTRHHRRLRAQVAAVPRLLDRGGVRAAALPSDRKVATLRFHNVRVGGNEETVAGGRAGRAGGDDQPPAVQRNDLRTQPGRHPRVQGQPPTSTTCTSAITCRCSSPQLGFLDLRVVGIYQQEDFTGGLPRALHRVASPCTRPSSGRSSRRRSFT